jgi:hypothetical protein
MIFLKTVETPDGLAIVLNDEVRDLLSVAPGAEIGVSVSDGGEVVFTGRDMSPEALRERGRAFIRRYAKTFEALAK